MPGTMKRLLIYSNDGNDNFQLVYSKWIDEAMGRLFISDLNNDNYPDIVYHSVIFDSLDHTDEENIFICFNNQDGTFSDMYHIGPCMFGFKLTSADFDNNGYLDIAVTSRDLHHVRILFNDGTGSFMEEPQVEIGNEELIINNCKLSNYPNPFKGSTNIMFNINRRENMFLKIDNTKGNLIKVINYTSSVGDNTISWDGSDKTGQKLPSGIYLYQLLSNDGVIHSNK